MAEDVETRQLGVCKRLSAFLGELLVFTSKIMSGSSSNAILVSDGRSLFDDLARVLRDRGKSGLETFGAPKKLDRHCWIPDNVHGSEHDHYTVDTVSSSAAKKPRQKGTYESRRTSNL